MKSPTIGLVTFLFVIGSLPSSPAQTTPLTASPSAVIDHGPLAAGVRPARQFRSPSLSAFRIWTKPKPCCSRSTRPEMPHITSSSARTNSPPALHQRMRRSRASSQHFETAGLPRKRQPQPPSKRPASPPISIAPSPWSCTTGNEVPAHNNAPGYPLPRASLTSPTIPPRDCGFGQVGGSRSG